MFTAVRLSDHSFALLAFDTAEVIHGDWDQIAAAIVERYALSQDHLHEIYLSLVGVYALDNCQGRLPVKSALPS